MLLSLYWFYFCFLEQDKSVSTFSMATVSIGDKCFSSLRSFLGYIFLLPLFSTRFQDPWHSSLSMPCLKLRCLHRTQYSNCDLASIKYVKDLTSPHDVDTLFLFIQPREVLRVFFFFPPPFKQLHLTVGSY